MITTDWKKRKLQYLLGSGLCIISALLIFSKRNNLIPQERLVSLGTLTLKEKPSKAKDPGKYGDHYLKFVFLEIDKPLRVSGMDYYCADKESLIKNFNQGDTLQVWVDKNDFEDYSGFEGKNIYGLNAGQQNYCNLDCRNKSFNQNQKIGTVAFSSMALGCLIAGLLPFKPRFRVSKDKIYEIEPIAVILLTTFVFTYLYKFLG